MAYKRLELESLKSEENEDPYLCMDLRPSGAQEHILGPTMHSRTWTIESGISGISFLSQEDECKTPSPVETSIVLNSKTESMDIPKSSSVQNGTFFHCNLPGNSPHKSLVYTMSAPSQRNEVVREGCEDPASLNGFQDSDAGVSVDSYVPLCPDQRSMRSCSSSSCLEGRSEGQKHSFDLTNTSMSIPRLLRNSFSKLIQRGNVPSSSRSPKSEKSSVSEPCTKSEGLTNLDELSLSDSINSLAILNSEEIIEDSLKKGLPIIPFDFPTFNEASQKMEETKTSIRKNSLKGLKKAFTENRFKNDDVYNEEEEINDNIIKDCIKAHDNQSETPSCSVKLSENLHIPDYRIPLNHTSTPQVSSQCSSSNKSPYIEMSISKDPTRDKFKRTLSLCEDPYMKMDDLTTEKSLHSKDKYRHQFDKIPNGTIKDYSSKVNTYPRRKLNIFKRHFEEPVKSDSGEVMHHSLGRRFKKGNKHKDDYVFVDFEKDNYYDMAKIGHNKWKFLSFSSSTQKF